MSKGGTLGSNPVPEPVTPRKGTVSAGGVQTGSNPVPKELAAISSNLQEAKPLIEKTKLTLNFSFNLKKNPPEPELAKPQLLKVKDLTPMQEKELKENGFNAKIDHLFCPITQLIMSDPVFAADGHTYERSAIEKWLSESRKSPMTGGTLLHTNLTPNYLIKSMISEVTANLTQSTDKQKLAFN